MSEPSSETPQPLQDKPKVADMTGLDSLATADPGQNTGEDNMIKTGDLGESQIRSTLEPRQSREELTQPVQEYRDLLNICFDENGNFTRRWETTGSKYLMREVWNGNEVLANLLHEPEATQYQAMILGLRPLFFQKTLYDYQQLQKFADETGKFKIYAHAFTKGTISAYMTIYNPELVGRVIEQNRDVFEDYQAGKNVDEYLGRAIKWGAFSSELDSNLMLNPLSAFKNTFIDLPEGTELTGEAWSPLTQVLYGGKIIDHYGQSTDIAAKDAMRKGLLLGFPKEVLKRVVDDRVKSIGIRQKLIKEHNRMVKSQDETSQKYVEIFREAEERALEASHAGKAVVWPQLETIAQEYADEFFPDLSDEDKVFLKSHPSEDFNRWKFWPSEEVKQFNQEIETTVEQSGIKEVQRELAEKYRKLKMRGLTGVLRRMLGIKTRVEDSSST